MTQSIGLELRMTCTTLTRSTGTMKATWTTGAACSGTPVSVPLGVLCCAALCCAVLRCAALRCAVLCCAVLCCAVLCCAVLFNTIHNVSNSIIAVCSVSNMGHPMVCCGAACYVYSLFPLCKHQGNQYFLNLHGLYLVLCTVSGILFVAGMKAAVASRR